MIFLLASGLPNPILCGIGFSNFDSVLFHEVAANYKVAEPYFAIMLGSEVEQGSATLIWCLFHVISASY